MLGRRKKEVRQRIRSTDVADVRKKKVRQRIRSTDVTDVRKKEAGRRKQEGRRKKDVIIAMVSGIDHVLSRASTAH
ncbi:hypothetical protein [Microcoleus sp. Pol17_C1]|uniref:hypothetical protein n=1 Tax=unclassified Microcoleus TaxID=2642155 RepID=UPI002FCF9206